MRRWCPYCNTDVEDSVYAEIEHMQSKHPDVIRERLGAIGEQPKEEEAMPSDAVKAELFKETLLIKLMDETHWERTTVEPIVDRLVGELATRELLPAFFEVKS